jgi:hypothetical protein
LGRRIWMMSGKTTSRGWWEREDFDEWKDGKMTNKLTELNLDLYM